MKNIFFLKNLGRFHLFFFTIFVYEILFSNPFVRARPTIGLLSVDVKYPSKGLEWFELFLQEELSLQLQLSKKFSVISPRIMSKWYKRINYSEKYDSNLNHLKNTDISMLKADMIFRISIQKVLKKLSVNWEISKFNEFESILEIKEIHSWLKPDDLVASLLNDLNKIDKLFRNINHYPFNYSWDAIRSFYQWRQKPLPKVNSIAWKEHKIEMESILLNYPAMTAHVKYSRAILKILESSLTNPANVPILDAAENDIIASMKSHPENADHHNLLSLIHLLRKENFFAKQEANIANKINNSNGLSLILYGLTVGKNPNAGENYIKRGLKLYPFFNEKFIDDWQPFNLLVKDLEPWMVSKSYKKKSNYEVLINNGREYYKDKIWEKATKAFEGASSLEPLLLEPQLYLAQINLSQNNITSAKNILKKLQLKFPKNADVKLYLGFANEKLKFHSKAESIYRSVLEQEPKNRKALLRLGSVLIKLGKLEEARSFLENLTKKYPFYTVAWWNLGIAYYQLGEFELAEIAWEESLRLEPENGQVRLILEKLRDELSFKQIQHL